MLNWEEECGINIEEALAVALEAASKAGQIIWSSVQQRRAIAASRLIPSAEDVKTQRAAKAAAAAAQGTETETAVSGAAAAARDAASGPQDGAPVDLTSAVAAMGSPTLAVETKSSSTDLVTQYDTMCDTVIQACLQAYSDRAYRDNPKAVFRFITEELNPDVPLTDALTWIVDPIDGTMSFVHGLPDCCVSIGLTYKKSPVLAVVFCPFLVSGVSATACMASFDRAGGAAGAGVGGAGSHTGSFVGVPLLHPALADLKSLKGHTSGTAGHSGNYGEATGRSGAPHSAGAGTPPPQTASGSGRTECHGEIYVAVKGRGCYLNGMPVRVRQEAAPKDALMVFNYPFNIRLSPEDIAAEAAAPGTVKPARRDAAIDCCARMRETMLLVPVQSVRMYGSGVLSLALIAAGRIDAYLEPASSAWDVCAAALLITEAGGVVRNMKGEPFDMSRDTTICAGANEQLVSFMTDISNKEKYYEYWSLPPPASI